MLYGLISVETINVQQIHRGVLYIRNGLVKSAAEKFGEGAVAFVVEPAKIQVDFFIVVSCLVVSLPSIHGITTNIQRAAYHRFAKSAVGDPVVGAKLH
jgi:hypothetical protein